MLSLPPEFLAHLGSDARSLTIVWGVIKRNGEALRGTAHDRELTLSSAPAPYAGTYSPRMAAFATDVQSMSDGAVSNLDVDGAMRVDAVAPEITPQEIEAGLYDQAEAFLLLVNWQEPDQGHKVVLHGTLGEFSRDSEGMYRSEVRGLTQALMQQIVRTYSQRCNVRLFGDARCGLAVGPLTRTGTVTAVTSRKQFLATLDAGAPAVNELYYNGGRLKFTSGANEDFVREARAVLLGDPDPDEINVLLWDEAPDDIELGDTFELPPGCDRTYQTCRFVHGNLLNFRGHGVFAVGRDALMRGAAGTAVQSATPGAMTQEEIDALLIEIALLFA